MDMLRTHGALIATVFIAVFLAYLAATPPAPRGLDTPDGAFSSARAMEDVRIIAAKPHPTDSEENAKVRAYLETRLKALGANVQIQSAPLDAHSLARLNRWSGEAKTSVTLHNVIGVIPGTDRTQPAVLLMAHHDTVWGSPGAADDTVGIATILEITRALNTKGQQDRDLIILFTDAEEVGLAGAVAFFNDNPFKDRIGAVINFEARGGGGTANMFQTSALNGNVARLYAKSVKQPSASSLSTYVYSVLPNDTDLTPALKRGYAAYNIANIGRAEYYHSPKIDVDALEEATLQHMGSQGLDLTRALMSADAFPTPAKDITFFDVFGLFTLTYPASIGMFFLLTAVFGFMLAETPQLPFGKARMKIIGIGALHMTVFIALGGGLLYGLNWISGSGPGADYYDRLATIPRLEILALCVCVATFAAVFGRKPLSPLHRFGAALPLFILGYIGHVIAPTAAYFITLSLMFCGIVSLLMGRWNQSKPARIVGVILCALVVGYMLALGHLLSLGVGPNMLSANILPAAMAALVILPIYAGMSKTARHSAAGILILLAVIIALWIRFDPVAATVPVY